MSVCTAKVDITWLSEEESRTYAKNRWGIVDGFWYYFGAEGRMLTGWQFLGGKWYYLHTKEDAVTRVGIKEGSMASSWYFDPIYQKWFYLGTATALNKVLLGGPLSAPL